MSSILHIVKRTLGQGDSKEDNGARLLPIPSPPALPWIGHLADLDREVPLKTFQRYAKTYGEVVKIHFFGTSLTLISTRKVLAEALDEKRFQKKVGGPLLQVRQLVSNALFTADNDDPTWGIAHRILMPAFSPIQIKNMFDDMYDLTSQLILKWERFGNARIDPSDDFTRLTFDTIALCSMGYRINSFYTRTLPPFVEAMGTYLLISQNRARMPEFINKTLFHSTTEKWLAASEVMRKAVDQLIEERRKQGDVRHDLLHLMLHGKDPQTGEGLSEENIRAQLITFLIAGHETTSGMLSFSMYFLLKNPEKYAKVRAEVDAVLGKNPIRPEHLGKLPYIMAVIRESLRLGPTIPIFAVTPREDTILAGKYWVKKEDPLLTLVHSIHTDPETWGDDAEVFKPERMMDGKFEALPPKAWVPFGSGARACIGRAFAIQEAIICLASIFQRFDFHMADPTYDLRLKQFMTVKPSNFYIHATQRQDTPPLLVGRPSLSSERTISRDLEKMDVQISHQGKGSEIKHSIRVLYGSNTGSSQSFAERMVMSSGGHGFKASLSTLDAASGQLTPGQPIIIITASFEGEPADNAGHFLQYLKSLKGQELKGIKYAVFGCGNKEWVNTYQRVPILIDEMLEEHGAERILARGDGDAGSGDFFEAFDSWESAVWENLAQIYDVHVSSTAQRIFDVTIESTAATRAASLRQPDTALATVVENRILTMPNNPAKHHIELKLPENMTYAAGDYLAILPLNPRVSIRKVLARFSLSSETSITIKSAESTSLPTGRPVSLEEILSGYVELGQPATKRNIHTLIELEKDDKGIKASLETLLDRFKDEILEKRTSLLDILISHPTLDISIGAFLSLLPTMRVRQYSISSSPLWDPTHVTLTISVLSPDTSSSSSSSLDPFIGVGSTFLSDLRKGDRLQVAVRPSASLFALPTDPSTPLVLFCAGAGIAPMRGFIQERAVQVKAGRKVGKVLLFFGCRYPDQDFLYKDTELKEWEKMGVVEIRMAFSRAPGISEGCKYVQDRIAHDGEDILAFYRQGAKFFTCGSGAMANSIKAVCVKLLERELGGPEEADAIFKQMLKERYAIDVFG